MTHDELLVKINYNLDNEVWLHNLGEAVRAVVELHIRVLDPVGRPECLSCRRHYPCPTIQEIESHLK